MRVYASSTLPRYAAAVRRDPEGSRRGPQSPRSEVQGRAVQLDPFSEPEHQPRPRLLILPGG
jgi:hypothetical protein